MSWVQEAAAADEDNDYLAACATLVANGYAAARRFGYVCSILPSYRRHLAREQLKAERAPKLNEYFGSVGEKVTLDVKLVFDVKPIDSDFGVSYLHTFEDADGRRFKWFGASRAGQYRGETMAIRGRIKGHGEWQGAKETQLTRVSVLAKGECAALEAARALIAEGEVARPEDDPGMQALGTAVKFMRRAKVWRLKP